MSRVLYFNLLIPHVFLNENIQDSNIFFFLIIELKKKKKKNGVR
jgi:hypothetical protein